MSKLSDIETICQSHSVASEEGKEDETEKTELEELVAAVIDILSATDDGFADGDDVEGDEEEEAEEERFLEDAIATESDEEY